MLADIEIQRRATEDINLEILESLQLGWAHRDLWVDNLLFNDSQLTAILDFDRLNYDYPQLDVARAVMSCALDNSLDVSLASAFIEGYSEERSVTEGYLTNYANEETIGKELTWQHLFFCSSSNWQDNGVTNRYIMVILDYSQWR
ncbi:Phosphotransferase enzyme family protein [Paenibacillus sophorae]|uniref:Phosphotransferase enzyme family protein n=1 Tax=Paenibacillus sophorae TaxID=1333845 RepID=A0A1H8L2W7_9BACL|nr:phosphotransferase [Paenibacillus sophorae]SEN99540.1 Phosphotransferase enzyme family protein [Paenibacillus sophorae]